MPTYTVKLKDRREVAEGTMAFWLERPADFRFWAGQYLVLGLIDPAETDKRGSRRTLSIASAPYEPDIMVAMRMRDSAFKRILGSLPIGTAVSIDGPFGEFNLPADSSRPAVFLAGGIGITPFRSLIRQAAHDKFPNRLYLFYSNPRPEDAAFLDELNELESNNPNYRFIVTMTDVPRSSRSWTGERGYLSREMLAKYIDDFTKPLYYLAGPPDMVKAMQEMLANAAVEPDNIRAEIFGGYSR